MKRLVTIAFLLCGMGAGLVGQEVMQCSCDTGMCTVRATWGRRETSFTIPLSAIAGLILEVSPVVGLVIPDVKITLDEKLYGTMMVGGCPEPCCAPGRTLRAATDVLLSGKTEPIGLPPTPASVTGVLRVVEVEDNKVGDRNLSPCAITADFSVPVSGVQVDLVFSGNVKLPLFGSAMGEVTGSAIVSCFCGGKPNAPPGLSLPAVVTVPIGGETRFPVRVNDPDNDPVWVYCHRPPDWLIITFDLQKGEGIARAASDAPVGVETAVDILVYDLKPDEVEVVVDRPKPGQFYHEVLYSLTIKVVANRPPRAISGGMTISHGEGCFGRVRYAATDPDLPDNYGYQLYFVPLGVPDNWDCSRAIDVSWDSFAQGMRGERSDGEYSLQFACRHVGCSWPRHPIPVGSYEFPFMVFEYNPLTRQYGFADQGVWTLTVTNKPPEVTVSPSKVKVRPGDVVTATVTATDPDKDTITLTKISGPGSFPTVTGEESVSSTYTWTVPKYWSSPWTLVGFRADDGWGGSGLAYLLIHIVQPPRAYGAHAWVNRGGTATTSLYIDDPDSFSHTFAFSPPEGITVRVVGKEDVPDYYGDYYGHLYQVEVSVDPRLCPGTYPVPFTVTDPDCDLRGVHAGRAAFMSLSLGWEANGGVEW